MKQRNYYIRTFRCPVCLNVMYATKPSYTMTKKGHEKKIWCPFCKMEINMEQIDSEHVKG